MKFKGVKGSITVNGKKSKVKTAFLMHPSAHHYGGNAFDMEFQVVTADYTLVTFVEAKKGEGNAFLESIGFGSGGIKALELGKKIRVGEVHKITNLLTDGSSYLSYEGEQLFGKCGKTKYIINPDIVYCGINDLEELRHGDKSDKLNAFFLKKRTKIQKIYQNYEAPAKGKSKTFKHRPKKDIEREEKAKRKKAEALKKAKTIADAQMTKPVKARKPSFMKSPYRRAQINKANSMHSHPRYAPVKSRA